MMPIHQYGIDNVYPANVWIDYLDDLGLPQTFRRSFYLTVGAGHSPDPPPLAEQLLPGLWEHRTFDLSSVAPPIAHIVEIRVGAEGWGYDAAFDNVSLMREVVGADCNGNGVLDATEISQGTSPDCNGNGVPDSCDLATAPLGDCDGNGVPDECDPDGDADGVPDVCDICPSVFDPAQLDSDTDGFGDACDCAPSDPTRVLGPVGELDDSLAFAPGSTSLMQWNGDPDALIFYVYRGVVPAGSAFAYDHSCVDATGTPVSTHDDPTLPGSGELLYYVVSGANGCGEGFLGFSSAGDPWPNPFSCLSSGAGN